MIGVYEILRELGRGGMGRVYLAKDTAVGGRLVAVKVILSADRDESSEAHARFLREISNLARLQHSQIVTIFTAGNYQGYPYFVMQYVPGRDLGRFLDECSILGERERTRKIVRVMADVARAVHHAHSRQIVHRDLKPSNILITHEADEAMVLDFGIAKYLGDASLTKGPESPGTPAFRAPEQIDVRLKVRDELVDVWAIGVMLYHALTGRYPFRGDDALSVSYQILHSTPEPLRQLNPAVPPAIEKVVSQCLEKQPEHRPPSALAIAEMLDGALDASSTDTRPPALASTPDSNLAPTALPEAELTRATPGERRAPMWVVLGTILIASVGVAVWIEARGSKGSSNVAQSVMPSPQASVMPSAQVGVPVARATAMAALTPQPAPSKLPEPSSHPGALEPRSSRHVPPDMVLVPAGPFFMGCNAASDSECFPDEKPGRTVEVGEFAIDRTEVIVGAYRRCVATGRCTTDGLTMPFYERKEQPEFAAYCNWARSDREEHPINCVDWFQARAYCTWLGRRLPTEEEWEKAARGTDGRKYPWGNTGYRSARRVANIADEAAKLRFPNLMIARGYDDGWAETAPVGGFPNGASPYGALDMVGNVWEWTATPYGPLTRVAKGGSWNLGPRHARASVRSKGVPRSRTAFRGFRCAL